MKYGELIRLLKKNNVYLYRHGQKHDIWYSPITNKKIPIPRHCKEVPIGTLNNILKDSGILFS